MSALTLVPNRNNLAPFHHGWPEHLRPRSLASPSTHWEILFMNANKDVTPPAPLSETLTKEKTLPLSKEIATASSNNDPKTDREQMTQVVNEPPPIKVVDRLAAECPPAVSKEKLYEENAKVTAIFWEWRHKVLTHFFGVSGALIAGTGWLYHASQNLRLWHCFPLFLAAIYSLISYKIDKRHTQILRASYRIAEGIELEARVEGSIFTFINGIHYDGGSLTQILHRLYRMSGVLFVVAGILVIIVSRIRPS
jgi:hypothetical protein